MAIIQNKLSISGVFPLLYKKLLKEKIKNQEIKEKINKDWAMMRLHKR